MWHLHILWSESCLGALNVFFSGHCLKGATGPGQKSPSLVFCDALWWTVSVSCVSGHGKDVNLHSGSTGHQTTCCFVEVCWTYGTKRAACSSFSLAFIHGLIVPHSFLWPSDNQLFSVIQILVFLLHRYFCPCSLVVSKAWFSFQSHNCENHYYTYFIVWMFGVWFNVLERHLLSSLRVYLFDQSYSKTGKFRSIITASNNFSNIF